MLKNKYILLKVLILTLYIANLCTSTCGHYISTDSEQVRRDTASASEGCQVSSDILESAELKCELNGSTVNCSKPIAEKTAVTIKCKPFYESTESLNSPSVCQNGTWSHSLLQCVPECGTFAQAVPLSVNGTSTPKGSSPWHVGIYKKDSDKYEYISGGTIINKNVVLSVCDCFTNAEGKLRDVTKYFVAAGKYYSDYSSPHDVLAQKRQVKAVTVPREYRGFLRNYAGDISVVIVDVPFEINNFVKPVCVDWTSQMENKLLQSNIPGKVAGWGLTNINDELAEELKEPTLSYVDRQNCLDSLPKQFIKFVTLDKFCAGYHLNGTSLCVGDAGGGLIFKNQENQKSYILGILSIGPLINGTCDPKAYTAFTKVSQYLDFIEIAQL